MTASAVRFRVRLGEYAAPLLCAIAVIVVVAVYVWRQPLILSPFGLTSLANVSTALVLAALGQTVVLLTGGLDLSIGAMISLVDCFAATFMGHGIASIAVVSIAALLIGVAAGAVNGLVVAFGRVEPLIATFCTLFIYTGLALIVRPQPGGFIADPFAMALTGNWGFLPLSVLLVLGGIVFVWVPVFRSRLGRFIVAVGDNADSGYASGVPVRAVQLSAYMLSGLFAGLAGLFLAAETTSGDPGIGGVYTLNSLAAAVLGGVSLAGGRGTAIGAILGSVLLSIILNLLSVVGISAFWQDFIEGALLILILSLGGLRLLRARSWIGLLGRGGS
ncbi:MAG: ABC transporter permease [Acetobacteraceae bacterium]